MLPVRRTLHWFVSCWRQFCTFGFRLSNWFFSRLLFLESYCLQPVFCFPFGPEIISKKPALPCAPWKSQKNSKRSGRFRSPETPCILESTSDYWARRFFWVRSVLLPVRLFFSLLSILVSYRSKKRFWRNNSAAAIWNTKKRFVAGCRQNTFFNSLFE